MLRTPPIDRGSPFYDEGLNAGLFRRLLIVGVELVRVEHDTVERVGHCRGCERRRGVNGRCVPAVGSSRSARG